MTVVSLLRFGEAMEAFDSGIPEAIDKKGEFNA